MLWKPSLAGGSRDLSGSWSHKLLGLGAGGGIPGGVSFAHMSAGGCWPPAGTSARAVGEPLRGLSMWWATWQCQAFSQSGSRFQKQASLRTDLF